MVKGIVGDVNIKGHFNVFGSLLAEKPWAEIWRGLNLRCFVFQELGLEDETPDSLVWTTCQREGVALLTDNRNADGPDSLEVTIRAFNTVDSLPVFTFSNAACFLAGGDYAEGR